MNKRLNNVLSKYRFRLKLVLLVMFIISLDLWFLTINRRIYSYPPDPMYYLKMLPIYYWIGLGVLILLSFFIIEMKYNSKILNLLVIIMYSLYLFGTPSVIYLLPRFRDVYGVIQNINFIILRKHAPLTGDITYPGSYPGTLFLWSSVHLVTSISLVNIAKYYPIYQTLFLLISIYIIAYNTLSKKYLAIVAPITASGLYWIQEYHFSPQGAVVLVYSTTLIILILGFYLKNMYQCIVPMLLCVVSLVISHALTILYLLLNIVVMLIYTAKFDKNKNIQLFFLLILLIPILYIGWMIFVGVAFWKILISTALAVWNIILKAQKIQPYYALQRPTLKWILISKIRIYITIFELLLTFLIGVYYLLHIRIKRKDSKVNNHLVLLFLGLFISDLIISFIGIGKEGTVYIGRFLLFLPFPFSIIIVKFIELDSKSKLIRFLKIVVTFYIILLVVLIPLTRYSEDILEFTPESYISLKSFSDYHQLESRVPLLDEIRTLRISSDLRCPIFSTPYFNYFEVAYQSGYRYKIALINNNNLNKIYTTNDYSIYCSLSRNTPS